MKFQLAWRQTGARLAAAALLMLGANSAMAQQEQTSTNRVNTETDWSVFVEDNPTECWAVSLPKETVNTRDGRVVAVRRGDILLFVFYRPGENVSGQVSFTGGYPFAPDSTVEVQISGNSYTLYTQGEWAWPRSPEDDARIVSAMKAGATATLTARSSRGTTTRDTFSLLGFTAASADAERRCTS